MIPDFPTLLKSSGHTLLDPLGFSKYRGQPLHAIPELYWKTYCGKYGINYGILLAKINESKKLYADSQNKKPRRELWLDRIRESLILNGVKEYLMKHQKKHAAKVRNKNYSLLAADIGTGKTFAILEIIRLRWMAGDRVLILCPGNVFSSWQKAIDDYFYKKASHITISGSAKDRLLKLDFDRHFYITNYESMSRIPKVFEKLKLMGFTWIIADEADEYFCNPSTSNWKTGMELSSGIEQRFILTGTPRRQNDDSLYGLVTFLDRGQRFGASFEKFKQKYFLREMPSQYLKERYQFLSAKGNLSKVELQELMKLKGMALTRLNPAYENEFHTKLNSIMFTVQKRDVLDLPPLTHEIIEIELTGEARKQYLEMQKNSIIEIENYCNVAGAKKKFSVEAGIILSRMMKLRQISCGYVHDTATNETIQFNQDKLNYLSNLLDKIHEPVIITCVHTHEIKDIERLCKDKNLKYGIIAGARTTNKKNIEIARNEFSLGHLNVLISQEKAGRAGIDGLQNNCSYMVEYSYGYSCTTHKQKVGRLERKGQKKAMTLITLESVIDSKPLVDRAIINTIKMGKEGFDYLIENLRKLNKLA